VVSLLNLPHDLILTMLIMGIVVLGGGIIVGIMQYLK